MLLPILILLLVGIIEFGRAYNMQLTVTAAAREGVRVMVIENDATKAKTATIAAAPTLNPGITSSQVTVTPCATGMNTTLTVKYPMTFIVGLIPGGGTITGKGVMRCSAS